MKSTTKESMPAGKKAWLLLAIFFGILAAHHFIMRPWFLNWGAPDQIQSLVLPGDQLVEGRGYTRAVLIEAAPEEIWPWVLQLGQDRGGMYSYTWLENLFYADMRNVYELRDELQLPRIKGDTIWLASPNHYDGMGYQILALVIPWRAFVMVSGRDYQRIVEGKKASGAWAIYLHPENEHFTWLIARSSGDDQPAVNRALRYFTYEVPHFVMEQKMLKTMKRLAEQNGPKNVD